jgi:hypothetical protein
MQPRRSVTTSQRYMKADGRPARSSAGVRMGRSSSAVVVDPFYDFTGPRVEARTQLEARAQLAGPDQPESRLRDRHLPGHRARRGSLNLRAHNHVAFRAVAFVALPAYRSTTIISVAVITYGTVTYLAVASVALLRLKTISYNLLSFAGVSITKHAVLWIGSDAHRVPIAILATVFCIIISKHLVRKPR